MDYAVIGDVSKGFSTAADVLTTIGKVLEVAIGILRATAFFSLGTSAALAQYLDTIKQKVQNLAKICTEFSGDLSNARPGRHSRQRCRNAKTKPIEKAAISQ